MALTPAPIRGDTNTGTVWQPASDSPHNSYLVHTRPTRQVIVFGHGGQPPTTNQVAWAERVLFGGDLKLSPTWLHWLTTSTSDDALHQGGGLLADPVAISVEYRTQAEIDVAAAGHTPDPVAVTNWNGAPGFPPFDGLDSTNYPWSEFITDGWSLLRILVSEDVEARGQSYVETVVAHELGHAFMLSLIQYWGSDWPAQNLCSMFGRPLSYFNDPALPWDQRVVEAAAETFKDLLLEPAQRAYTNLTKLQLPFSRMRDFVELFTVATDPYTIYDNDTSVFYHEADDFLPGDYENIVSGEGPRFVMASDDWVAEFQSGSFPLVPRTQAVFRWPYEGGIFFHWQNHHDEAYPYCHELQYVEDFDLTHGTTDCEGSTIPHPHPLDWSLNLTATYYALQPTGLPGAALGTFERRVTYRDAIHGMVPVGLPTTIYDPAHWPPVEGVVVEFQVGGVVPRGLLEVFADGVWQSAVNYPTFGRTHAPMSYVQPWIHYVAPHAQWPRPAVEWPYKVQGALKLGDASTGRVVLPHRVHGRTLRGR